MKRKLLITLAVVFIIIQFFGTERVELPLIEEQDFFMVHEAPEEIKSLVRTACYDCHSHTTEYPWYSEIAPVSWWLDDHVSEGRSHINFSTWGVLSEADKRHALEECAEALEQKEMPMLPYMVLHQEAWLDETQRAELGKFFMGLD